ncbi:hypothetical protein HX857_12405 [Pseudomonas gingeri]|uniref:Uncharacterized protein n=1 Tax=Pseudomonas gingeri TaxID=117681 RepID=A0A7Y8CCV8_9PSED|nr:hypothetical protein [Pseudomonas gingeri]NWC13377.1 hypothetical protein [Pseudomonas gingeri]NWE69503.1 hypothetical protein [Pseudomonas gingeri]
MSDLAMGWKAWLGQYVDGHDCACIILRASHWPSIKPYQAAITTSATG